MILHLKLLKVSFQSSFDIYIYTYIHRAVPRGILRDMQMKDITLLKDKHLRVWCQRCCMIVNSADDACVAGRTLNWVSSCVHT